MTFNKLQILASQIKDQNQVFYLKKNYLRPRPQRQDKIFLNLVTHTHIYTAYLRKMLLICFLMNALKPRNFP